MAIEASIDGIDDLNCFEQVRNITFCERSVPTFDLTM